MSVAAVDSSLDVANVIQYVARKSSIKYAQWVDETDIAAELWVYALGAGKGPLAKYVGDGEARRVYLTLFGVATIYAEREKAIQSGYHPDDTAWYAPGRVASLLPMATDPTFDGSGQAPTGIDSEIRSKGFGPEGGNLLVQVFDVRSALKARPDAARVLEYATVGDDDWLDALATLSDWLGGDYPEAPGYIRKRRTVESNVSAQSRLGGNW